MTTDFLTIGIPTYNRVAVVVHHVQELIKESVPDVARVLIIDNASTDGTFESLRELCNETPIRLLRNDSNLGYKGNYLRLFEECETEYLVVTSDEDHIVCANLGMLVSFLQTNRPLFVSPQFHHQELDDGRVKLVRGRNETRPIHPHEFMQASFNGSGLTYNVGEGRKAVGDILSHVERDGQCYPQTLVAAELMLRGPAVWWGVALALKLHHLPTTNIDPILGAHNHVPWRWLQHRLFVDFFTDRISKSDDPAVKEIATQMLQAEHRRTFQVLRDAIGRESPDTLGTLDREARVFYAGADLAATRRPGSRQSDSDLIRNSISYQLGYALTQSVSRPGRNTILLPYRITRLFVEGLKRWRAITHRHDDKGRTPAGDPGVRRGTGSSMSVRSDPPAKGGPVAFSSKAGTMGMKMYVDESGIPYTDYGNQKGNPSGIQHSIVAVAERGLWYWNEFNLSGCGDQVLLSYDWAKWPINKDQSPTTADSARTMLLNCADWLMDRLTDRGSYLIWCYDYPSYYGVQAGWGSAHAQALGIQLLLRASELSDVGYSVPVERLLTAFSVPIEEGGLLDNSDPRAPWFEKFASPESQRPKVLNGMLFTLLGLHDAASRTGLEAPMRQYKRGLKSALQLMERYDLGDWSAYNIQGKPASAHYHRIHIEQLDRLFHIEGDGQLAQWRDRFASYKSLPGPDKDRPKPRSDNLQEERDKLKKQLSEVKNSFSYRLGNMLVQAVYRPGRNTILLPYRLIRLCAIQLGRRRARSQSASASSSLGPLQIRVLNIKNAVRYGRSAPKFGEVIWVDPQRVTRGLPSSVTRELFGRMPPQTSGRVVESSWPVEQAFRITGVPEQCFDNGVDAIGLEAKFRIRFKSCIDHWVHGIPWEETGVYELMERLMSKSKARPHEGCRNMDDVVRRYENLDRVFDQVKQEGRLRLKTEADSKNHWIDDREAVVHIGPGGEPFFGGYSLHRFAIAYILNLPFPAQIGLVHKSALPYLDGFRMFRGHHTETGPQR